MATPAEKLANSLESLKNLQDQGKVAIKSHELTRTHRERLVKNGFLQEVIKGWYIPANPHDSPGDSTAFYASFWEFAAAYLNERFDDQWCLSPEQSLSLQVGNWTVPPQLLVRAPSANNKLTALLHNVSLLDVRSAMPDPKYIQEKQGLRLYSIPATLMMCSPQMFAQKKIDIRAALSMIHDPAALLVFLLEGGHSSIAGRLAGAFRNLGNTYIADEILKTMQAAGYTVREQDPFVNTQPTLTFSTREHSPYVNRLKIMWHEMRPVILDHFPAAPGIPDDKIAYLKNIEEIYVNDAYHSLSIEGYRVDPALIQRVREQNWDPDHSIQDKKEQNALAARGYWQAFQAVKQSVKNVLNGANPGEIANKQHGDWYRELFAPSVTAGLLKPSDLAGYRTSAVYIKRSMHVPPNDEAVRDLMPTFYELLQQETAASVRVVLGHFVFVNIHPYVDGNGRIGRFLMNVMLAAGGYPWTIVPVTQRDAYLSSLEQASTQQNIAPFSAFIAKLVKDSL
jgi:hypothetical protein